jgi:hypothetical protein
MEPNKFARSGGKVSRAFSDLEHRGDALELLYSSSGRYPGVTSNLQNGHKCSRGIQDFRTACQRKFIATTRVLNKIK